MRLLPISLVLFALAHTCAGGADFTPVLARPQLWELSQEQIVSDPLFQGFEWTSAAKDTARSRSAAGINVAGLPVVETIARFDQGKLSRLTFSLYNRGDAGDLAAAEFGKRIDQALAAVTSQCGSAPRPDDGDASAIVRTQGRLWTTATARWLLQWSFTREVKTRGIPFRAEFIRLEVSPPAAARSLLEEAAERRSANEAAKPVLRTAKKESNGDVWLESVPMVDQGEKGYCVVATVERVLRFYGRDADQHELAQIANTATAGGTNVGNMVEALKKLTARLKIRVRPQFDWDVNGFLKLIDDYNRKAKREKLPLIEVGTNIDLGEIYRTMKPDLLKEVRLGERGDFTRFKNAIGHSIDEGVPLLWSVQLGIFPEPGVPQAGGGHMRLIIGYNTKTNELIFSDSWGAGHEKKRYPLDQAWAITTALYTVEPF